jgi:hypothetical protein
MEKKCGTMEPPDIRANSSRARKMGMGDSTGRMAATTKASL